MQIEETARWRGRDREVPGAPRFQEQLAAVEKALEEGLARGELSAFYETFRSSDLPFIAAAHQEDGIGLFRACFEILHRLGGLSPAAALAIENHYYVTAALATFPAEDMPDLESRRRALLERIVGERLLVANTSTAVHADKLGAHGTQARREGSGFRIDGTAAYTSLASEGDILVFISAVEGGGAAIFFAPMRDNPCIDIGPLLLPESMLESDTRRITFRDLLLSREDVFLDSASGRLDAMLTFEMIWHQLLIPTLYLGAAARAIEEARRFLRGVRGADGHPLARLDGMVVDVGRLSLSYRSARGLAFHASEGLEAVRKTLDRRALDEASDLASASKYVGTRCAEEILTEVRRIIGARAFTGGHPVERLSRDVMFGPLGPKVNAVIERKFGQRVLGDDSV